jgi:DNA-binding NarL/FixJ family response regulator
MAGELPLSPDVAAMVLSHFSQTEQPAEPSPLTNRENEVLTLIGSGASTPEVASALNISKYTVEDHLKQIYRKLEISNRAEAALAARNLKLV